MQLNKMMHFLLILALVAGCGACGGGDSGSSSGGGTTPSLPVVTGDNVMTITVNGSLCSNNSYINKPCVSVTICTPATSTCQTINDILLDTGDSGLRIFQQALSVSLTQVTSSGIPVAECLQYADGSSVWGPVKTAGVVLGNEPAVEVPIHVIDSTFGTAPAGCSGAYALMTPADAGYNGSLGVSFFAQDCGTTCRDSASNGNPTYYACSGATCNATAVPLANQVQNPVALLPVDNNGVIVQLPSVPASGSASVNGYLVLGIGTRSNNAPSAVTAYAANASGNFITVFNGSNYTGFIDTGSNGLFFPTPSALTLPDCAAHDSAWYCPSSTRDLNATTKGASGAPSGVVSFQIANFDTLLASPANNVFADIGGDNADFDWGLPFHLGRNVYIGIEGKASSLGSGLYWAY
jgi:hypothetical protein